MPRCGGRRGAAGAGPPVDKSARSTGQHQTFGLGSDLYTYISDRQNLDDDYNIILCLYLTKYDMDGGPGDRRTKIKSPAQVWKLLNTSLNDVKGTISHRNSLLELIDVLDAVRAA